MSRGLLAQCGHSSLALTWMSMPACPSRTGAELFHHTRAPPAWAATWPAHHRAHSAPWAPAIPTDALSDDEAPCPLGASTTRRVRRVAFPGHTAARSDGGTDPRDGSDARTRARVAPSHPSRRRCARHASTAATASTSAATPTAMRAARGDLGSTEWNLQPMKATMSSAETTGRTRMSVAGRGDPPPRRVMPGQARRCGLGRTSKVSSPRRIRVPATTPVCARERARTGRSRRARIAGAPGARRSSA